MQLGYGASVAIAAGSTTTAKVKRLFFLPLSLFFYICGGGRSTLYDRRRVTREEGITSFSLALLHFPFLIENCKPLHYWYRGQKFQKAFLEEVHPLRLVSPIDSSSPKTSKDNRDTDRYGEQPRNLSRKSESQGRIPLDGKRKRLGKREQRMFPNPELRDRRQE
ncbi:unnamed protein product [Lupinus luteus]|uniref:Uncharacterized protein n=1 Tax=Lupinus luteus TaxID=3873 RepID=A0AAV1VQR0_LUPLU